jgi:hypothetical protein
VNGRATLISRILLGVLLACVCLPEVSQAAPRVALEVGFTPERLGKGTTMVFDFQIGSLTDPPSSPLTGVDLRGPGDIAYDTSTLGLASCLPEVLSTRGPGGCPNNSRVGSGAAAVDFSLGSQVLTEQATVAALVGNSEGGNVEILYYVAGESPAIAQMVLTGQLLSNLSGSRFETSIPSVPVLPGAPDASVVNFQSTIGPRDLYYYAESHGKRVRYRPRGIVLPARCPAGGFPFSAVFSFQDGSTVAGSDTVGCPPRSKGAG